MSVEQGQYSSREFLNNPEVAVDFAPPITANELLGKRLQDAKGLSLTKAPMSMFKVERSVMDI